MNVSNHTTIPFIHDAQLKTYAFKVVVEPDDDRWFAYCPLFKARGAATWGYTKEEALKNIHEVVEMVVEELIEDGEQILTVSTILKTR